MTRLLKTTVFGLLLLAGGAAQAANVEFRQLNWLNDDGSMQIFASAVGEAEFAFNAGDPQDQQFLQDLGGGYINVVLSANGGAPDWVVQNLYVAYPDEAYLEGSTPSVQFRLPIADGEVVEFVDYDLVVTPEPLLDPMFDLDSFSTVQLKDYLAGGRNGAGSGSAETPLLIGPWIGGFIDDLPVDWAWISVPTSDIAEIDEDNMGCAPGSCARSIKYLSDTNDFDTDDAQDIYDDLYDDMETDAGGTSDPDMLNGKKKYTSREGLPICTKLVYNFGEQIQDIIEKLRDGADVEILISWSGGGGHAAMITSIVKHADGSYTITYVDDPDQGDGTAENEEHTIKVDANGNFQGGVVDGFLVEVHCTPGDLDGDGDVDQTDLGTFLVSYGTFDGLPGYNPDADFNGDGWVDQSDLGILLGNYGE
jgi:hypothetical protein